jgi:hypothetical protein
MIELQRNKQLVKQVAWVIGKKLAIHELSIVDAVRLETTNASADTIHRAFIWATTPQGVDFWHEIDCGRWPYSYVTKNIYMHQRLIKQVAKVIGKKLAKHELSIAEVSSKSANSENVVDALMWYETPQGEDFWWDIYHGRWPYNYKRGK